MRWRVTLRTVDCALAADLRSFLADHRVAFAEARALGGVELSVHCSQSDAVRLADAVALLGTRALFDGLGALIIAVPEVERG